MDGLAGTWLQFVLCVILIAVAGARLSRYADIIGRTTGWSGTCTGLILLSTVTSVPELATGISAVGFAKTPEIAVGDILGSCVFNLLILSVIDALYRKEPLYCSVSPTHALSAALGMGLMALTGAVMLLGKRLDALSLWHVGIQAPAVLLMYALAMRVIFKHNQQQDDNAPDAEEDGGSDGISLRRAIVQYAVAAAAIVAAGGWLPFVAMRLSELMGWQQAFVGTLFVAVATSLPELSVSLAALRMGKLDMAVANLLGSNLFNITVLAIDDLFYRPGPLLSHVAPIHAVSAFAALAMGAIVIAAMLARPRRRVLGMIGWPSVGLLTVFALNSVAQYLFGES